MAQRAKKVENLNIAGRRLAPLCHFRGRSAHWVRIFNLPRGILDQDPRIADWVRFFKIVVGRKIGFESQRCTESAHWVRIFKIARWHPGPGCSNRRLGSFYQAVSDRKIGFVPQCAQNPLLGFVFSTLPSGILGQALESPIGFVFSKSSAAARLGSLN
jgi:hypothetical protein